MGYIKKLKNNELVGGTDKHTIYPVTSAEAVFEEVSDNEFKSQKYLNNHITNERIVDNTIENDKLKDDTIDMGKLNTQLKTIIQNAYDASWKVKEEPFSLETKYDANDVVYDPATNSSYVSLTADNQGNPVRLEDEEEVNPYWRLVINGISAVQATEEIEATKDELIDYIQENLKDQVDDEIADAESRVAAAEQYAQGVIAEAEQTARSISGIVYQTVAATPNYTDTIPVQNKAVTAQIGYYTCSGGSGATIIVDDTDAAAFTPVKGGQVKILMTQKSAVTSGNVQLQFGSVAATKKILVYNEDPVSSSNTWEVGEVIAVYYDGTKYHASSAQGGSNKKINAYLYGDLRTLAAGQVYKKDEAVKTTDNQFLRITKDINVLSLSETLAAGDIKVSGSKTYRAASDINTFNPSTSYSEGAYALGNMTVYTLTVTADDITAGNITVNGTDVAIEDTDNAAAIASKIATALVIDGWTDSASENVVTVRCNTIGNNTTTITIDVGDTGVIVEGASTPSITGTDVIMKYDGESWAAASLNGMETDGVLIETDEAWLITNATQQNTLLKDITANEEIDIASISRVNCFMYKADNTWKWQNNYTTSGGNWGKFIPVEGGRTYILEALQYTNSKYGFLKDNTHVTGIVTNYATGETGHILVNNTTVAIVAPFDAKYLFVNTNNGTTDSTPKAVYTVKYIKDIKKSQDITEDYLYGNLKTVTLGVTYDAGAIVINSDGTSLKITKEVSLMNLNDIIQAGDCKVYGGHTYKAVKDVPAYSGEDSDYASGDYAIINSRVNSFDGSAWTALTNISTYVSNTEYWKSLTVDELVSEVTDKTYNTEYSIETLYYRDGTALSSPNTSSGAPTILAGFRVIAGHTYRIYIKSKSSIPGTLKLGLGSNGSISIAAASILNGYTWNKTATATADSRIYLDGSTVTGIEIYTKIQDVTDPSTISITKKTSIKEKIQELDSKINSSDSSISELADSISEITKSYDGLIERDITKFVGTIIAGGYYSPVSNYLTVSPDSESNQNGVATIVSPKGSTRFGWYIGSLPINMDIIISMDIVSSRTGGQSAFDKNVDGGSINTAEGGGSIITRWYSSDSTSNVYNLTTTNTNYKFIIRRTNSIKYLMCPTSSLAAGQIITISNFSAIIRCSQYDYERFFTRPEQKMMLRAATSSNGQVKDANAVSLLHFSDIHGDSTAAFAIRSFYDDNASDIDDILNTGDTVQSRFANDFDFYLKAHLTDALYCLGNHDGATADSWYWTDTPRNQVYARYIGSYAENWGITQPENAVTDSLMYWYKDYTTQKIRLICLDTVWSNADANYKTAELAWFRSVLSDAATNEYKVVVCSHYLPGYCDEGDIVKNQLDSPNNMHDYDFTLSSNTFSSYDQPSMLIDYITAVESFIHNDNGTFIVWLCGHLHNSLFWRVKGHPDILAMTIDCAGNIAGSWHKYHRFKRGLEDCFCAHQIIINGQYIKCIQLGFQVDKLLRSSKSLTYDYINKKVISEN